MSLSTLQLQRWLHAPVERVWEAWTVPAHVRSWWGPEGVTCTEVAIDLRVGGQYAIANLTPDGQVMWIRGTFEQIEEHRQLVYTWGTNDATADQRVTVHFEAHAGGTRVTIRHERLPDDGVREQHEAGWSGCLDGLARFLQPDGAPSEA